MYARFFFLSSFVVTCQSLSSYNLMSLFLPYFTVLLFFLTCGNVRFISQSCFPSPVLFVFVILLYCIVTFLYIYFSLQFYYHVSSRFSFSFAVVAVVIFVFLAILSCYVRYYKYFHHLLFSFAYFVFGFNFCHALLFVL